MGLVVNDSSKLRVGVITPSEVSNLFFNADTSTITGLSDGTLVTTINDLVSGNNLTQSNSTYQFNYRLNQFNGYASLNKEVSPTKNYYGNNNNIENLWSGDLTLLYVVNIPTISTPNDIITSGVFNYSGGASGGFQLYVASAYIQYRELNLTATFSSPQMAYNVGLNLIIVNIKRSGISYITVNGVRSIMSNNTPAYNQSIFDNIYIGTSPVLTGGTPTGFKFCQLVIYSRSLSFQEELNVGRGLKFKWGI